MTDSVGDSSSILRLARQAADGNHEAFACLFGRHRRELRHFLDLRIEQRLRRRIDPSDVLQETQLVAYRRLGDFLNQDRVPLRVWLRRLTLEQWLNQREKHLKAARRSVDRECHVPNRSSRLLSKNLMDRGLSPSDYLQKREQEQQMVHAIAMLPELDREILLMRTMEDLSFKEIAHILDLSHDATRQRYGRALIRLQRLVRRQETRPGEDQQEGEDEEPQR